MSLNTANAILSNAITVDSSYNVGLGTSSPNTKLQINGTDLASFTSTSYAPLFLQGGAYTGSQVQAIDFGSSSYTKPLVRIGAKIGSSGSLLQFGTSNAYSTGITNTAMTIDYGGSIGIGTTSPQVLFHLYDASLPRIQFSNSTTGTANTTGFQLYQSGLTAIVTNKSAGDIVFGTSDTERMRILANGNVGIGTSSPQRHFVVSNGGADGVEIGNEGTAGSIISYNRSTGAYLPLTIQNGGGAVWIGTGSGVNAQGLFIGGSSSSFFNLYANYSGSSVGFEMTNSANTLKVQFFGSSGNYYFAGSNISDRRSKSNIQEISEGLSKLVQLKPSTFTYDKNPEIVKGGFIAQEVLEVVPEFVTIPEDETEMMGVDYYGILALAVKSIQELEARLKILENK